MRALAFGCTPVLALIWARLAQYNLRNRIDSCYKTLNYYEISSDFHI